ncbi:MAG TPA: S8 family serine peptidase [Candidatus Paceibacterota bacterium]
MLNTWLIIAGFTLSAGTGGAFTIALPSVTPAELRSLDQPETTSTNAVVRLIVKPIISQWPEIKRFYTNHNIRVVKTLSSIGNFQIVEVPVVKSNLFELPETLKLFSSIESGITPSFDVRPDGTRAIGYGRAVSLPTSDPLFAFSEDHFVPYDSSTAVKTFQWSITNSGQSIQAYQRFQDAWVPYLGRQPEPAGTNASLHVAEAWQIRDNAKGIRLCIIDSGIAENNPDLPLDSVLLHDAGGDPVCFSASSTSRLSGSPMNITSNVLADIFDRSGHGTEMAGLACAVRDNGIGISGIAPGADLLVARMASFSLDEAIASIDWAIENKADVINCSWGFDVDSPVLRSAIEAAEHAEIVLVCAVLNAPFDYDTGVEDYPARYKRSPLYYGGFGNIAAVCSTMSDDRLFPGGTGWGKNTVDFGAPGRRLPTTGIGSLPFKSVSGTSVATAQVSACLAILKAEYPAESAAGLIDRLLQSADPVPSLAETTISGGRVNLHKALLFGRSVSKPGMLRFSFVH